jgi:hypothetical protein
MAERPVVWISHRAGERCAGCAAEVFTGDFVQITGETGIRCAKCAGLADLIYLPAGDPALTRSGRSVSTASSSSGSVACFAPEVFTGDFVQITGETGGILWNCLLGRHPGDMETYGRLLTRRSGRWHDQIDKSPTCHRMELWRRTGCYGDSADRSTTYARAYGRPWLRTTPEAHDPS